MAQDYRLRRSHRLAGREAFARVLHAGMRRAHGPLAVQAMANDLGHPRLGIVIGRRVGTAVRRNRIKRLIREAFRLMQHDLPGGFDLVVLVRPHEPMPAAEYRKLLFGLLDRIRFAAEKKRAGETGA